MPTEAEIALKKKYELLRKKKEQQQQQKQGAAGAKAEAKPAGQPRRVISKEEAVRALHAKWAAEQQKGGAPPVAAATKPAAKATVGPDGALKLKFVIPKREGASITASEQPATAGQATAAKPAAGRSAAAAAGKPTDPARAAAVAALREREAKRKAEEEARAAQGPKRPTVKRPTVRRPAPSGASAAAAGDTPLQGAAPEAAAAAPGAADAEGYAAAYQQQPYEGTFAGGALGHDVGFPEYQQQAYAANAGGSEGGATLFVGDLPLYWTTHALQAYMEEFGAVAEARVMGSQRYGFVTFVNPEDAQGVMEFWEQQGLEADAHHMLRLEWAKGSMPDWKKGPALVRELAPGEGPHLMEAYEHPRVKEARLQAQATVAQLEAQHAQQGDMVPDVGPSQRELVSYDDL